MSAPDGAADRGPEWALLEALARGTGPAQRATAAARLVRAGLDWGELVEHALRHRMLPMVASLLEEQRLHDAVPMRVSEHLRSVLALNRHRRGVWYGEVYRVVTALQAAGIDVLTRKGAAYEVDLYGGNGSRWLGDIDLLVRPDQRQAAADLMPGLGYVCGLYDFDEGVVVPFDRTELMKYRLNPDHLPTQSLRTDDPLVPVLEVDYANSLTWARSVYQVPIEPVFDSIERYEVPGMGTLTRAGAPYRFLDTVLHLFREAWVEWWLEKEQDVDLMKFGDVLRLWQRHREQLRQPDFVQALERFGVLDPVCWVLEHLDRTFATTTVADLGLTGRIDEEFLHSAGGDAGRPRQWTGSMRDRLYAKNRRAVFAGPATP
ncbi:nucleotidyltransferase family protein [Dactylosporangium sp. NPDC050688]|uniref:nucleotidyltransferase family protein n=1 Tax=Dactylosporangium sp. NPDC050688 TaxID=3157217 RepID=UPI0033E03A3B